MTNTKQPWQMTPQEYSKFKADVAADFPFGKNIQSLHQVNDTISSLKSKIGKAQSSLFNANTPNTIKRVKDDTAALENSLAEAVSVKTSIEAERPAQISRHNAAVDRWFTDHAVLVEQGVIKPSTNPDNKDIKWAVITAPISHKDMIKKALAEGKSVPPEILNDYPELKPQQETTVDVVT